ncbi:MAG: hypothetical protein IJJ73_00060 [Bacteroidaceae bacterium]|nr:hypothetical protein [Bacteroidaceae bacterium]
MNKTDEILERLKGQQPVIDDSEDLTERIMSSLPDREVPRHDRRNLVGRTLLYTSSIAAVLLVGFFLYQNRPKEQPVVTQQTETHKTPLPEPNNVEQENTPLTVEKHHVVKSQTSNVKLANIKREVGLHHVSSSEEPLLASLETEQDDSPSPSERAVEQLEEEPVISPEKQALVDIFLAEEVLQVAYEIHEQTEPLRAYIATLEGRELETSHQIISF